MKLIKLLAFLQCPYCGGTLRQNALSGLMCNSCATGYPIVSGVPILMQSDRFNLQEAKQKLWFDDHYGKFSDKKYQLENWRLSMLDRLFTSVSGNKIHSYLDIGCGATGYTVIEGVKRMGWLSIGADISVQAMIKAKTLAEKEGVADQTGFVVCSAEHLPFKNASFDYISAVSLLEHLDKDQEAVNSIVTKITVGGYFYICVPNTYRRMWPFLWPVYKYLDYRIGHKRHYSIESLTAIMPKKMVIKKVLYNAHLIKLLQYGYEKLGLINDQKWWSIEKNDINSNPYGIQLNAVYQKTQ